jgi:hypothetical protein
MECTLKVNLRIAISLLFKILILLTSFVFFTTGLIVFYDIRVGEWKFNSERDGIDGYRKHVELKDSDGDNTTISNNRNKFSTLWSLSVVIFPDNSKTLAVKNIIQ